MASIRVEISLKESENCPASLVASTMPPTARAARAASIFRTKSAACARGFATAAMPSSRLERPPRMLVSEGVVWSMPAKIRSTVRSTVAMTGLLQ